MATRRQFISTTASGALGLALAGCARNPAPDASSDKQGSVPLKLLVLGGTGFIGPHMVRDALARGHQVTLFNRGRTNTHLFPEVERLVGDRDGKLDALAGRQWDAVIDNSGYVPRHVRDSAKLLASAVKQYLFVSSISAYRDFEAIGIDEDYPVGTMPDETVEEVTGATYGPMKALCEQAVRDAFGEGATVVRPGFIVGPGDRSDRWTYWPARISRGGTVLAPGTPDDPIQIIDARDLAAFVNGALEQQAGGTFNLAGPEQPIPMGAMLNTINQVTGGNASFRWVDAQTLEKHNARLPIWAPADGEFGGAHRVSNTRAIAKGLRFRPLADTARDTLSWWQGLDAERRATMRSGLRVGSGDPEAMRPGPLSLEQQMELEAELLAKLA